MICINTKTVISIIHRQLPVFQLLVNICGPEELNFQAIERQSETPLLKIVKNNLTDFLDVLSKTKIPIKSAIADGKVNHINYMYYL